MAVAGFRIGTIDGLCLNGKIMMFSLVHLDNTPITDPFHQNVHDMLHANVHVTQVLLVHHEVHLDSLLLISGLSGRRVSVSGPNSHLQVSDFHVYDSILINRYLL